MLHELKQFGYQSKGFIFSERIVHLHAMISSVGYQRETSTSYDWDGLKRGKTVFFLWQYTISGRGKLTYENHEIDIVPGDAMLLSLPHQNRYRLPPDSGHWEFIFICLYGREIMRILGKVLEQTGPVLETLPDSSTIKLSMEIFRGAINNELANPFDCSAAAYNFAANLAREYMILSVANRELPEFAELAAAYAKTNFTDPIGVEEMASASGYSRYHFSRKFAEATGTTPAVYLKNLRLKESARLLREANLTVKEIAAKSGFSSAAYFCAAFKQEYGITPETFRSSGMF